MVDSLPVAQQAAAPVVAEAYKVLAAMLQLATVEQVERLWVVRKAFLPPLAAEEVAEAEVPAGEALSTAAAVERVRSVPRMPRQVVALTTVAVVVAVAVGTKVPRSAMHPPVEGSHHQPYQQEPAMAARLAITRAALALQGRTPP